MTDSTHMGENTALLKPLIEDMAKLQSHGGTVTITPLFATLITESLQLRLLLELVASTASHLQLEYDTNAWYITIDCLNNAAIEVQGFSHRDFNACLSNTLRELQAQLASPVVRPLPTIPDPTPKDEELLKELEREYQVADMASSGSREAKLIRLLAAMVRKEKQ